MWLLENKKTGPTRLLWRADHFILKEGIIQVWKRVKDNDVRDSFSCNKYHYNNGLEISPGKLCEILNRPKIVNALGTEALFDMFCISPFLFPPFFQDSQVSSQNLILTSSSAKHTHVMSKSQPAVPSHPHGTKWDAMSHACQWPIIFLLGFFFMFGFLVGQVLTFCSSIFSV